MKGWNGGAVHDENIEIAVIVIIKQRHAAYHRFRLIFVGRRAAVGDKSQTRALRDLFKNDRPVWRSSRDKAGSQQ